MTNLRWTRYPGRGNLRTAPAIILVSGIHVAEWAAETTVHELVRGLSFGPGYKSGPQSGPWPEGQDGPVVPANHPPFWVVRHINPDPGGIDAAGNMNHAFLSSAMEAKAQPENLRLWRGALRYPEMVDLCRKIQADILEISFQEEIAGVISMHAEGILAGTHCAHSGDLAASIFEGGPSTPFDVGFVYREWLHVVPHGYYIHKADGHYSLAQPRLMGPLPLWVEDTLKVPAIDLECKADITDLPTADKSVRRIFEIADLFTRWTQKHG